MYLTIRRNVIRTQNLLAGGFLLMLVASGFVKIPASSSAESRQMGVAERVGVGGCLYRPISVQPSDARVAGTERGKTNVITRIGEGGSINFSIEVKTGGSECVVAEGVVYPYSKPPSH